MNKRRLSNPPQKYKVGETVLYKHYPGTKRGKILSAHLYGPKTGWYYKIEGVSWYVKEDEIESRIA